MNRIFFLTLLVFILLSGTSSAHIKAVASIAPLKFFIEEIGGKGSCKEILIPPGADPHSFELTSSQLKHVEGAACIVIMGSGIEFEDILLTKVASLKKKIVIIDCSRGIKKIGNDPHIWLSPRNGAIIARTITEEYIRMDPQGMNEYQKQYILLLEKLSFLDRSIRKTIEESKIKKMISIHPAWTYFCAEYGIEQIPVEREGKEPGPQTIATVVSLAKKNRIRTLFSSPQSNPGIARAIAASIKGKITILNPLAESYIQNLFYVADALAKSARF